MALTALDLALTLMEVTQVDLMTAISQTSLIPGSILTDMAPLAMLPALAAMVTPVLD